MQEWWKQIVFQELISNAWRNLYNNITICMYDQ